MPLHLVKLCVGCDSVRELKGRIRQRRADLRARGAKPEHIHRTRMMPRRAAELLDGGSLYWVIRGEIACRQRIRELRKYRDPDGVGRCALVLDAKVVLVVPRAYRPFQGWRYLEHDAAPRDLDAAAPGACEMPEQLRRELAELGLM